MKLRTRKWIEECKKLPTLSVGPAFFGGAAVAAGAALLRISGTGTPASTSITDDGPSHLSITNLNSVVYSSNYPGFGGTSIEFLGSNQELRIDSPAGLLDIGLEDFTYDVSFRGRSTDQACLGGQWTLGGGSNSTWILHYTNAGSVTLYEGISAPGVSTAVVSTTTNGYSLNSREYFHIRICRTVNTWRMFLNGVMVDKATTPARNLSAGGNNKPFSIGQANGTFTGLIGNLYDARLIKGFCANITDDSFEPPTAALTDNGAETWALPAGVFTYKSTGDQSYTVPAGKTTIAAKLWGGGGAGGLAGVGGGGGGAGYQYTELAVTPLETLIIRVGRGGKALSVGTTPNGGMYGGGPGGTQGGRGGPGGDYSAIFRGSTLLALAPGGGGGASHLANNAGAGGGGTTGGNAPAGSGGTGGGFGGTQSAGGAAGSGGTPTAGSSLQGGTGSTADGNGGGGGGGYFGGGGGGGTVAGCSGGGGGSAYNSSGTGSTSAGSNADTSTGAGGAAGNAADSDRAGAGDGGRNGGSDYLNPAHGKDGRIVITPL